jgi:hypothetical protein
VSEIALFYRIRITLIYHPQLPPHFHAHYADYKAAVNIVHGNVLKGNFPGRQLKLVLAWCELHRDELMQNWELAKMGKPLNRISPLV